MSSTNTKTASDKLRSSILSSFVKAATGGAMLGLVAGICLCLLATNKD